MANVGDYEVSNALFRRMNLKCGKHHRVDKPLLIDFQQLPVLKML